jgi:hypothetical protein
VSSTLPDLDPDFSPDGIFTRPSSVTMMFDGASFNKSGIGSAAPARHRGHRGLITSTMLTLVVLPVLYEWVEERWLRRRQARTWRWNSGIRYAE